MQLHDRPLEGFTPYQLIIKSLYVLMNISPFSSPSYCFLPTFLSFRWLLPLFSLFLDSCNAGSVRLHSTLFIRTEQIFAFVIMTLNHHNIASVCLFNTHTHTLQKISAAQGDIVKKSVILEAIRLRHCIIIRIN